MHAANEGEYGRRTRWRKKSSDGTHTQRGRRVSLFPSTKGTLQQHCKRKSTTRLSVHLDCILRVQRWKRASCR